MRMFAIIVESLIQEAMEAGKFEHLRGAGKPIDLRTYFETPAEVRAAHAALQSAGMLPREVEVLGEIAELEAMRAPVNEDGLGKGRQRKLERLRLELNLLLERNKPRRAKDRS